MQQLLTDKSLMPFGIHKDLRMEQVPAQYLLYIYDNKLIANKYYNVERYIEDNMETLKMQSIKKR